MAGNTPPGPLGTTTSNTAIDQGTLALTASTVPVTVGGGPAAPGGAGGGAPPPDTPPPPGARKPRGAARPRAGGGEN